MKASMVAVFVIPALLISILTGCDSSSSESSDNGQATAPGPQLDQDWIQPLTGPVITQLSALGTPLFPGGTVELHVDAYSPLDEELSYEWVVPSNWTTIDESDHRLVLQAPDEMAVRATIQVNVTAKEQSRSARIDLVTRGPGITDFTVTERLSGDDVIGYDLSALASNFTGGTIDYAYNIGGAYHYPEGQDFRWNLTKPALGGYTDLQVIATDQDGLNAKASQQVWLDSYRIFPTPGANRHGNGRLLEQFKGPQTTATGARAITGPDYQSDSHSVPVDHNNIAYYSVNRPGGAQLSAIRAGSVPDGESAIIWTLGGAGSSYSLDYISDAIVVTAQRLYVVARETGDTNAQLFAMNQSGGNETSRISWSLSIPTDNPSNDRPRVIAGQFNPIANTNPVYLTSGRSVHAVVPLSSSSGALDWQFEFPNRIAGMPVISAHNVMYINTQDNKIQALDLDKLNNYKGQTDPLVWEHQRGSGGLFLNSVIGSDGTLYFAYRRKIIAVDGNPKTPAHQRVLWRFNAEELELPEQLTLSHISMDNEGHLYLTKNNQHLISLYTDPNLEANERTRWSLDLTEYFTDLVNADAYGAPAVDADNTLFYLAQQSELLALLSGNDLTPEERLLWRRNPFGSEDQNIRALPTISSEALVWNRSGNLIMLPTQ